jgi:hypothetical protein
MEQIKQLGIWMDHSNAFLMKLTDDTIVEKTITSEFTPYEKEFTLEKSERMMHNKEQQDQATYYKKIGDVIKNYNKVILFGPTNAKLELLNLIRADHQFENIMIEARNSDKMTPDQMHEFVREYFK